MTSLDEPIDESKPFAEFNATGELQFDDHLLPITCTIQVSRDGTITVSTSPFDITDQTAWIFNYVPGKGRLAKWARLRATTPTGERVESEHVIMNERNDQFGPGVNTVALKGDLSALAVHYTTTPPSTPGCRLVYWTVGMKGFGVQHATVAVGTIRLAGHAHITDYDYIAGRLQITSNEQEPQSLEAWTQACDDQAADLLLIISLAEGKLLEWSIRQTIKDTRVIKTDFYGPKHTGAPQDGIFPWLNLQPIMELAITKYTQPVRESTGIELAIRLLLVHPLHAELQLVTAMTALEHLISIHIKHHPLQPPIDKKMFAELIRPALEDAYNATTATLQRPADETERKDFAHGIDRVRDQIRSNLNKTNFNDRLFKMLDDCQVPLGGIKDSITKAVKARNDVIHTGRHDAPFPEFYVHVAVLRELIKRIILTLLGYEGQYISFLNGQEFLHFPPTNATITEPSSRS